MASPGKANASKTKSSSRNKQTRAPGRSTPAPVTVDKPSARKILHHASTQTDQDVPTAAERSDSDAGVELPKLCDACSKSMLHYIAAIQQFLEGVANDVSNKVNPVTKYALRTDGKSGRPLLRSSDNQATDVTTGHGQKTKQRSAEKESFLPGVKSKSKISETSRAATSSSDGSKPANVALYDHSEKALHHQDGHVYHDQFAKDSESKTAQSYSNNEPSTPTSDNNRFEGTRNQFEPSSGHHEEHKGERDSTDGQIEYRQTFSSQQNPSQEYHVGNGYSKSADGVDNSITTNDDRLAQGSIFDASQNIHHDGVGGEHTFPAHYGSEHAKDVLIQNSETWTGRMLDRDENLIETQLVEDEAFVTLARNNADAIGCLVLGVSLRRSRTNRTLCVLVSSSVSVDFLGPLSSVFDVVQKLRSLDSLGTTKLALLDQPDLGISFMKLNVWRLVQFTKCVYMNCDTMVVNNCDELFECEELSAVPDIGWPDCFNNAVFVFRPSMATFWKLLDFAEQNTSYDGGDQGILNDYFKSWSEDINKKLSFIYNLMANVSYGYTPAFRRFGQNVRVVQFIGTLKPWHVKFISESGKIASSTSVHPTYVRFIQCWLHMFRTDVIPKFSQEVQNYVSSHEILSPDELLRFFPSSSDFDFQLSQPSVRLRPLEHLQSGHTNEAIAALRRLISSSTQDRVSDSNVQQQPTVETEDNEATTEDSSEANPVLDDENTDAGQIPDSTSLLESEGKDETLEDGDGIGMPGSSLGNYQGMLAWEQGRMDYQGRANSDTIIKRLHFLIRGGPEQI